MKIDNSKLKKYIIIFLFICLCFMVADKIAKADTITNYRTNYFYYQENRGAHSTGYRSGSSNKVTLGGTDNQGNNFDYLYGAISDIPYSISKGTRYSVKVCLRYSSLGDNEFNESNFNRFNDINLTYGSPQIQVEAVSSTYDLTQPLLLQLDVCSTYNFMAVQSNNSFAIGFRSDSYNSFGVYRHKYNIIASVYSVDVFEGATSIQPIIDQNNTIINQNQTIINQNNTTNNKLDDLNDSLTDTTAPDDPDFGNNLNVSSMTPITDLITMPITLYNKIISESDKSCSSYSIPFGLVSGSNYTLTLPCIDIANYLGSNLKVIIDDLFCLFMIYEICMLGVTIFDEATSLKDSFDSLYVPRHSSDIPRHGGPVNYG